MTVLVDMTNTTNLAHPYLTGVQRVVVHVLSELIKAGGDVALVRFDAGTREMIFMEVLQLQEPVRHHGSLGKTANDSRETCGDYSPALRRARPITEAIKTGDTILCLGLSWFVPGYFDAISLAKQKGARIVQLIHDINFITHPQWVTPDCIVEGKQWLAASVRNADLLIVTSRFQQREVEVYLTDQAMRRPPIVRVRLGDDPPLFVPPSHIEHQKSKLSSSPFVLCVSGFYPRKNHTALYHVWRQLAGDRGADCPDLLLVGSRDPTPLRLLDQIAADPLTHNRIRVRSDVGDEELLRMYLECLFTIYPSYYEGSGLPVVESLRLGRYCIASSAEALREAGGDLLDYFDPADESALYDRVVRALDSKEFVVQREERIRSEYRPWSWRQTAAQISAAVDLISNAPNG